MDADHLDFFKDIDDIRHSFRLFAEKLPADGTLIINSDTPHYEDIIRGSAMRSHHLRDWNMKLIIQQPILHTIPSVTRPLPVCITVKPQEPSP